VRKSKLQTTCATATALALALVAACSPAKPAPSQTEAAAKLAPAAAKQTPNECSTSAPVTTNYAVLVDLSKTWHNDASRGRNETYLKNVGAAISQAALDPRNCPTAVRYHLIGKGSLFREPVCYATFVPMLMAQAGGDPNLITDRKKIQKYLVEKCPLLLKAPPEQSTEVTAAFVTAVKSMNKNSRYKRVIVFSDLKEEPVSKYDISKDDFTGVEVVLIYRALPEDQADPRLLQGRIEYWTQKLESRGAQVIAEPDTGLAMSVGDLTAILQKGIGKN